jgi:hypothetical protein
MKEQRENQTMIDQLGAQMQLFDREKAAQYFIVAWVKNWKLQTYLSAVGASSMDYYKICELYPWMPSGKNVHYYFKNTDVRAWCAIAMRSINDKLWDTDDNAKRLALSKRVEHWDSSGVKQTTRHAKDTKEHRLDMLETRQSGLAHKMSMETMRRGGGHHWSVVK